MNQVNRQDRTAAKQDVWPYCHLRAFSLIAFTMAT